jgi:hypothetical protein
MLHFSIDTALSNSGGDPNVLTILQIESNDSSGKTVSFTSFNSSANAVRWTAKDWINATRVEGTSLMYDISAEYGCVGWFSHDRSGLVLHIYSMNSDEEEYIKKASFFM